MRIAVFCVGNRLHMDDGIGPAVFDAVTQNYEIPENVLFFDVGVMTMDLISYVDSCDVIIAVDAVEGTEKPVGTIVRFTPEDAAPRSMYTPSSSIPMFWVNARLPMEHRTASAST